MLKVICCTLVNILAMYHFISASFEACFTAICLFYSTRLHHFSRERISILPLLFLVICMMEIIFVRFYFVGLLLSEFRHGWKTTIHIIPDKLKRKSSFQTYMVVAVKEGSSEPIPILSSFDHTTVDNSTDQVETVF